MILDGLFKTVTIEAPGLDRASVVKVPVLQDLVAEDILSDPPSDPTDRQAWLVGSSPSGAWTGNSNRVAIWGGEALGGWVFVIPWIGMTVWLASEGLPYIWTGSLWTPIPTDPLVHSDIFDDFVSGSLTSLGIGALGWNLRTSAGSADSHPAEVDHPGVIEIRTSTSGDVTALCLNGPTADIDGTFMFGDVALTLFVVAALDSVNVTYRLGLFSDADGNPPSNGVYFEHLNTDTNWFAVCRQGGTQTRVDTNLALSSEWLVMKLVRSGSSMKFYLDGALVATIDTNLPGDAVDLSPSMEVVPSSAALKRLHIDFFRIRTKSLDRATG